MESFGAIGERLQVGPVQQAVGSGPKRKVALASFGQSQLCVGFASAFPGDQLRETMKDILAKWAS